MNRDILQLIEADEISKIKSLLTPSSRELSGTNYSAADSKLSYVKLTNLSLLHIAALYNSVESFMYLVENCNMSIDQPSAENYKPIHYACLGGATEVVAYILNKTKDSKGHSCEASKDTTTPRQALFLAVTSGNCQVIQMLLENGCDPKSPKNKQDSPIKKAIELHYIDVIKLLLQASARGEGYEQDTALMFAIRRAEYSAVPLLLDAGEDPYPYISRSGSLMPECALMLACQQQQPETVQLICNRLGARMNSLKDNPGTYPVHWLCQSGNVEIARTILQYGINVNAIDITGKAGPAYMIGRSYGTSTEAKIQILDLLYEKGFDPNLKCKKPLLAEFTDALTVENAIIQWLLEHGADPHVKIPGLNITIYEKMMTKTTPIKNLFLQYAQPPPSQFSQ